MSSNYRRIIRLGACLITVVALAACAAAPAPKVRCDTELRPINPPQHPLP
ncbi:MAG TPA: hypothetical protein VK727_04865 [Steroidobacteraceae bacterium]|nr:hypothetical protein [Steroidobacteraceae bacterium]